MSGYPRWIMEPKTQKIADSNGRYIQQLLDSLNPPSPSMPKASKGKGGARPNERHNPSGRNEHGA